MATGKSVDCELKSVGTDKTGDVVSEWIFKWNFMVIDGSD
jgi:hypothetical protein